MGPLHNLRIVELAGIGPCPMTGMMLADMGAEVIRVERGTRLRHDQTNDASFRNKKSIALDLKQPAGLEALLRLVDKADALIEGFRPGVAERLGFGPDICAQRNPRLVFGRMTGWGQDGPLAKVAGHDLNYIALSGALWHIGRKGERPVPPLNLVGDMGGGGMLLAFGVVCALLEAQRSGKGQVVDAAMVDGSALLTWMLPGFAASGMWNLRERGVNFLDGGAPYYDTYETADGKFVAIGSIEPQFYDLLVDLAGLDKAQFGTRDPRRWPELATALRDVFKSKTRDEWCGIMEGTDVCFAPVLSLTEAAEHPHLKARQTWIDVDGFKQPAPAPRFSRTPQGVRHGRRPVGGDADAVLADAGLSAAEIESLRKQGALLE